MEASAAEHCAVLPPFLPAQLQVQGPVPETLDAVPEEAMEEILKNPDPVAWLATFDPRVNEHKVWFQNMLDEIKKILSSSEEPSA